jgi:hypothetical protein
MKAYTLAATLLRVLGVLLLLHSIYLFLGYLSTRFGSYSQLAEVESLDSFLRTIVFGAVIYFAAPILAKIAAWKIRE